MRRYPWEHPVYVEPAPRRGFGEWLAGWVGLIARDLRAVFGD